MRPHIALYELLKGANGAMVSRFIVYKLIIKKLLTTVTNFKMGYK